jgi:diaminopimelate epimerase
MQLPFYKYHGNGNDFIIADNRKQEIPYNDRILIKKLCDRNFGIGADGLMLLEDKPGFDFYMRYFNSDGNEGSMCGNGGRCIVCFARDLGIIDKTAMFSGVDGSHEARIEPGGMVQLRMQDVNSIQRDGAAYILNTGSPHYVLITRGIDELDVIAEGRKIRNSGKYREKGVNVNFVEPAGDGIRIRTYERGVENETLACGTGSVAAALCSFTGDRKGKNRIRVYTMGGMLEVVFTRAGSTFREIWLIGPAKKVFHGIIETGDLL